MNPIHYTIRLTPDPDAGRFSGNVEILVESEREVDSLTLDARDITVHTCSIDGRAATAEAHPDREELVVRFPESRRGRFAVALAFEGVHGDAMAGFYRTKYRSRDGDGYLAVTQFEETDARRAFPCFDHPGRKATFDVEIAVPAGHIAIANTSVEEARPTEDGRTVYRFERTPRMSTYLLFFGAGPFDVIEDLTWRVPIRLAAAPGKAELGRRSLEYARRALAFCETYTGIPYPISKMDLVAMPDFAYGAMENFGAITYRENLVLEYPGATTETDLIDMGTVTAHEVAHMWFGDLVSPKEWRYVWLNEAFATYFGFLVAAAEYPDWASMEQFVAEGMSGAMDRDSLRDTVPIELPGDEKAVIDPSTSPIVYSKAAAVLRMVHHHIGDDRFSAGVRSFLQAYAFACAATDDFFRAFGEGAGEAARAILETWIREPGYPIVEIERSGRAVTLRPRRFTILPGASDGRWKVPVRVLSIGAGGATSTVDVLLDGGTERAVTLPADAEHYVVNPGRSGFYRVRYPDADLDALCRLASEGRLSPEDRSTLLSDCTALFLRGDMDPAALLRRLEEIASRATDYLTVVTASGCLRGLYQLGAPWASAVAESGRTVLAAALRGVGMEPKQGEPTRNRLVRASVLRSLLAFGDPAVREYLGGRFALLRAGSRVHPEEHAAAMIAGAAADPASFPWFAEQIRRTDLPETTARNLVAAIGWFPDAPTIDRVLELTASEVPARNRIHAVRSVGGNPGAYDLLWPWFVRHADAFAALHPFHLSVFISVVVPVTEPERESEVTAFLKEYSGRRPGTLDGTIRMSLERMRIRSAVLARGAMMKGGGR